VNNVVIADDEGLMRVALRTLINDAEDMSLAGEAADGIAAVTEVRRLRPDVALVDVHMPGVSGLEATRRITGDPALSATRVIVLTTSEFDEHLFDALRFGARGVLAKDADPADLLRAIRLVARGEALLSPRVTARLIDDLIAHPVRTLTPHPQLPTLTTREREVVALVGEGLTNEEIADRLVVSPATAKTHVSRARIKLGARDRAQLVVFAYDCGLVPTPATPRQSAVVAAPAQAPPQGTIESPSRHSPMRRLQTVAAM